MGTVTRVGYIGLGNQGGPIARRIARAGFPLTVWARRSEAAAAFAAIADVVSTPAELGAVSDVVGICVVSDADVKEVLLGPGGVIAGMAPGGVVAVQSTVHPTTVTCVAKYARKRDVFVIDAPVSGGAQAAEAGTVTVLAGGESAPIERCRPVFDSFAGNVFHLGPVGSGQTAKLINNLVVAAHLAIAVEAFDFARGLGVDRKEFARVLASGSGSSHAATFLSECGFDLGEMWQHSRRLLAKDLDIVLDVAEECGVGEPPAVVDAALSYLKGRSC